ncbi:MAG: hypothetical protein H7259_10955 [Cytophagales bacterium]|nr:hypothetical protein [Cytophaga sp.]
MKKTLSALFILFSLFSCSDKTGDASQVQADSTTVADSLSVHHHETSEADFNEDLIPENTETIVTQQVTLYIDSLLDKTSGATLEYGQPITVKRFTGTVVNGNWAEPVYYVVFKLPALNEEYSGYLPLSSFACFQKTLADNSNVYLTLSFDATKNNFIGNVLLTDHSNKKIADKNVDFGLPVETEAPYTYYYYFSIVDLKETGLEGVKNAFTVNSAYDACAYPTIDKIFFWNGIRLIEGPETSSVFDADIYHLYNTLYLPSDSLGKLGYIKQIIESDAPVGDPETVADYKTDSIVILYKWNRMAGHAKGDTILKASRIYTPANK